MNFSGHILLRVLGNHSLTPVCVSHKSCILTSVSSCPVQSLAELAALQGLEEDHTFQKEVALKMLVYKAYRSGFSHTHTQ